jgi:hypothetical protein
MASMSDYLEGQLINHIFRTASYTKPTVLAIALCTAAPTDASTGATITEVTNAGGYARVSMGAPLDATWAAPTGNNGTTSNVGAITFAAATLDWNAAVTHVAIVDSATYGAGNVLFWGALASSKTVTNGDTFQFAAGQLSVQLDN